MKAIQYTAPRQFAVVDLPKPEPGPHQVVIRVKACGICKTDLTIHDGSFLAKFPLVNGCLLYTSDAADDSLRVDLGGRRII